MESHAEARARREQEFYDARFVDGDGRRRSSAFYKIARPSQERFIQRIDEIPAGATVLKLGCGPSSVAWDLWNRGVEVTGIGISSAAIDAARSNAIDQKVDPDFLHVGSAEQLDLDDDSFDVVIGSSILHHLDLSLALPDIRRVLTPVGRAFFYEPLGRNPAINLYRRLTPSERSGDEHPVVVDDFNVLRREFHHVGRVFPSGVPRCGTAIEDALLLTGTPVAGARRHVVVRPRPIGATTCVGCGNGGQRARRRLMASQLRMSR